MKQYITPCLEVIVVRPTSIVTTSPDYTLRYIYDDGESSIGYMKYGNQDEAW